MDKAMLMNGAAIQARTGATGLAAVRAALKRMVARDAKRGLVSRIVDLSDPKVVAPWGVPPVSADLDPKAHKRAVDAIDAKEAPDYFLLVGGPDLFPWVSLRNPVQDDDDTEVPSDLPYACDAPWSRDASKFVAPSRVVGRLPGLFGASNPRELVRRLDAASAWTPRPASFYGRHLAISAKVWKRSTELSARNLFGPNAKVRLSPKEGPAWTAAEMAATVHFVNCHGATADPVFYGQQGSKYPPALLASRVATHAAPGTLVAAECCYGAELFDPALAQAAGHPTGIADAYLDRGAFAYFGSTTIAYGPAAGNGSADLITQGFLRRVLLGASVGRATLETRQSFVQGMAVTDPIDLKTLAQFVLLGDPSVTPLEEAPPPAPEGVSAKSFSARAEATATLARRSRRTNLRKRALGIRATQPCVAGSTRVTKPPADLRAIAREEGLVAPCFRTYRVRMPAGTKRVFVSKDAKGRKGSPRQGPVSIHLLSKRTPGKGPGADRITAVVVREQDGRIIGRRRVESR